MELLRFKKFILLIDGIHKSIGKIRVDIAPSLGVKSVHVFWIYDLLMHPEGLTSAEIAAVSMVDRSLVSREIATLRKGGYITSDSEGPRQGYNSRIRLTEKGEELARRIIAEATKVQDMADAGVTEEELVTLYNTLEKLNSNLSAISSATKAAPKDGGVPVVDLK